MSQVFVVCPCFNEDAVLKSFAQQLTLVLDGLRSSPSGDVVSTCVVFVDDGSRDDTWDVIRSLKLESQGVAVCGIRLARNFGHESAVCAGLDKVMADLACRDEDTVIIMDSDGQHPPVWIVEMLEARGAGFHHVQMIREDAGESGGPLKRLTSPIFYRLFSWLSGLELRPGASDFRAFSGTFLQQYLRFAETNRFNRGLFVWMGFKTKLIPYRPDARMAGTSSYTIPRMFRLAALGITYFSSRPLMLTTGLITGGGFLVCGVYVLAEIVKMAQGAPYVAGWPTIFFVVTIWGSLISLNQWILSAYVARIFDEVKRRPSYVVEETVS
jgi:glycosyltransferase involved in cell wall biosynthesis